jgi:hypothetical protein
MPAFAGMTVERLEISEQTKKRKETTPVAMSEGYIPFHPDPSGPGCRPL